MAMHKIQKSLREVESNVMQCSVAFRSCITRFISLVATSIDRTSWQSLQNISRSKIYISNAPFSIFPSLTKSSSDAGWKVLWEEKEIVKGERIKKRWWKYVAKRRKEKKEEKDKQEIENDFPPLWRSHEEGQDWERIKESRIRNEKEGGGRERMMRKRR